jgi:hypothetical protein
MDRRELMKLYGQEEKDGKLMKKRHEQELRDLVSYHGQKRQALRTANKTGRQQPVPDSIYDVVEGKDDEPQPSLWSSSSSSRIIGEMWSSSSTTNDDPLFSDWKIEIFSEVDEIVQGLREQEGGTVVDVYYVHAYVLGTSSEYFKLLFTNASFAESANRTCKLGLPANVINYFPDFLDYCYGKGEEGFKFDLRNLFQVVLSPSSSIDDVDVDLCEKINAFEYLANRFQVDGISKMVETAILASMPKYCCTQTVFDILGLYCDLTIPLSTTTIPRMMGLWLSRNVKKPSILHVQRGLRLLNRCYSGDHNGSSSSSNNNEQLLLLRNDDGLIATRDALLPIVSTWLAAMNKNQSRIEITSIPNANLQTEIVSSMASAKKKSSGDAGSMKKQKIDA